MSEKGDGSVLELNSGELEGENNAASKFKCNLTSDNIPLIMGLNTEYSNNGGTSAGNLGLNLLQNFDLENNLLHCDISGVFEWIRQRTDSVSSADLDCMRIDCNEAVVTTSGLISPNEEPVGVGDLEGAVQTESTFSNAVSSSHTHNDTLNSTLLDELTCLQADDHLIKEEGLINESVFQYSPHQKDESKLHVSANNEVKNEFSSEGANISDNSTNEVLVSEKCSKVSVFKNTSSLPYVKIPKKCILSGKIIKKDAYSLITKNILSTRPCTEVNKGMQSSQSNVIEAVPLTTYATESLCENGFENNDEICLMLTEDRFKPSFIDETLQENENDNLVSSSDNQEKSSAKTVVAISTNKLEDVTEIIIKTETGEALYKGKGSDILMASNSAPNLLLKFDSNVKDKQKLLPQTADKNDNSENAVEETAMVVSDDIKTDDPVTSVEDEPITEALKALGIANEQWDSYKVIKGQQCVWFCPLENCDCLFNKLSSLKIHILTHYKLRPFKCDFTGCEWSFYTNFRLKRHKETHLGKKEFKCPFETCNRSFTTVYNLHTHLKLHERPADLLCPVSGCGQAFQTRRNMESHLKEHGTEHAPYVCDYIGCEKRYYSTSALQSHSKTHSHNIEDLRCEYCFKMFDKPCRLKAHLRSHTGVKPYKCNYEGCDWAFTTSSKLNRHQAKHTQERRFSCSLCSKAFLRSEHLKDHTLKHFLTRAFVCPISGCNQQFSAKSSLYVHVKKHRKKENENTEESGGHLTKETDLLSVLSDASRLTCPVEECKYFFSSKDEVASHMQTCHKNIRIELKAQVKDLNALDTIELMNGEDNLISLESLNFKDPSSVTGLNLANLGTDGIVVSLPEYITSTDDLTGLSVLNTTSGQIEFSENVQSNSSKDISSCDIPLSSIQTITTLPTDIGSARTGLTYQDALAERELRKSFSKRTTVGRKRVSVNPESLLKENNAMQVTSDIVLTAGLLGGSQENLSRGLMFQDDLVGSSDLYSCIAEETGLNDSSAPGEFFQVFILESPGVKNCDFEQSTINLRDLE